MAGTPIVHKDLYVTQRLIFKVTFANTAAKTVGTLPKNALVTRVTAHVVTAFDGTTPSGLVGFSGDTDALATAADLALTAAGVKFGAAATLTAGAKGPLSAAKDVLFTPTITDSTAGEAWVIVEYQYPHEIVGPVAFD